MELLLATWGASNISSVASKKIIWYRQAWSAPSVPVYSLKCGKWSYKRAEPKSDSTTCSSQPDAGLGYRQIVNLITRSAATQVFTGQPSATLVPWLYLPTRHFVPRTLIPIWSWIHLSIFKCFLSSKHIFIYYLSIRGLWFYFKSH